MHEYDMEGTAKVVLEFSKLILSRVKETATKEEFLASFDENEFDKLMEIMGYCFQKANTIAYNFLEHKTPLEHPNFALLGFCVATVAFKVDFWDGDESSPYEAYKQFGMNNLTREVALTILKNQELIRNFSVKFYDVWTRIVNKELYDRMRSNPWE